MKKQSLFERMSPKFLLIVTVCIFTLLYFGKGLPDIIQTNIDNISVLKHYSSNSRTKISKKKVTNRAFENAEVAFARMQMQTMDLSDELYQAFKMLQPNISSLSHLYMVAEQGFQALAPYLVPSDLTVQLTQHTDGQEWVLRGLSIAHFSWANGNFVLVLWWEKLQPSAKPVAPLMAQSISKPYLSDELVGVPVGFEVLNQDPRFTISAQLKNRRFSRSYPYPYLVNFQDLAMSGVRVCQARYQLHTDASNGAYLELWPGCALDSPSYSMSSTDIFLLIDRFKTTDGCRGTLGVWWNVNVGNGTGGRHPNDWVTQALLFDSLRENASNGRLQFAAYDGGSALLDFVFLLRIGVESVL